MSRRVLHQFVASAYPGDATTDFALLLQRWLQEWGYDSDLFAEYIDPALSESVFPSDAYRPGEGERHLIYHHGSGSDLADRLTDGPSRIILIYHNITPPEFFHGLDPATARRLRRGRGQLQTLRAYTDLALGVSAYNEAELRAAGFAPTAVLPLSFDPARYNATADPALAARLQHHDPLLLFVGRLVPNKRQEDLIKLLYHVRQRRPTAHLVLVGDPWYQAYVKWLARLAGEVGVADNVTFAGHVSQTALVTYYRQADLYVSMSAHEGVGKPFLESMHLGLPILAYAAAGVPGTLGDAGVLFHEKDYVALAELVLLLTEDASLRERLIAGQTRRLAAFSPAAVRRQLEHHLATLSQAAPLPA